MNKEVKENMIFFLQVMLVIAIVFGFLLAMVTVFQGSNHCSVYFFKQWLGFSYGILCVEIMIIGMGISMVIHPETGSPIVLLGAVMLCVGLPFMT